MLCAHCGVQNAEDANFCCGCGRSFKTSAPAAYSVRLSDLPDVSRSRLLAAIKNVPPETFVIKESKLGWAAVALAGGAVGLVFVILQANSYGWQSEDIVTHLLVVMACFAIGWNSAAYLVMLARSDFKRYALVNPLYFLRFRFDRIEGVGLSSAGAWDAKHLSDSRGAYAGTRFYFQAGGKCHTLRIKSLPIANEMIVALKGFPGFVRNLIQNQDSRSLYSIDLLYEWRQREESFPRTIKRPPAGFRYAVARLGPTLLATLAGMVVFFVVILPYNDWCDDELRWQAAANTATAAAYRLYVASRPDGRHSTEAHAAIGALYEKAAENYRTSTGISGSEGIEAVIRILEYAKASGHYKVMVKFSGDNEIPDDIDSRLRSMYEVTRLVPILPSFTDSMNRAREARILERISSSFGKVIPGDILQFARGEAGPQDPAFNVDYVIKASGSLYYPERQEHLPMGSRDWYTGISVGWDFNVAVPGTNISRFHFSLQSEPAELFHVAYQRAGINGEEISPVEVYGAMADSAFADFGSKLLSELSLK
jgi:hypothetical protein